MSNEVRICWANYQISRLGMYRSILIVFALIFGPLVFCEMQKTKYLQIITAVFRWMGALPQKQIKSFLYIYLLSYFRFYQRLRL